MPNTLLLRLTGPMQSWGTRSRFTIRDGANEPSKSGVVGLLCAALGRPRDASVDDLAALRMGVRVDREGRPSMDYQTAGGTHRGTDRYGVAKASGAAPGTLISTRHYLADADFLVGLESEDLGQLERLRDALDRPRWQIFLGRKSYVASEPILPRDGLRHGEALEPALRNFPRIDGSPAEAARLILEVRPGEPHADDVRQDQPVGAAFRDRTFGARAIATKLRPASAGNHQDKEEDDVPVTADPQPPL